MQMRNFNTKMKNNFCICIHSALVIMGWTCIKLGMKHPAKEWTDCKITGSRTKWPHTISIPILVHFRQKSELKLKMGVSHSLLPLLVNVDHPLFDAWMQILMDESIIYVIDAGQLLNSIARGQLKGVNFLII